MTTARRLCRDRDGRRASRARLACAPAPKRTARLRVGSVRSGDPRWVVHCRKSVTKYMHKGYKIDTVSKGCRVWCSCAFVR